jgi:hypothetical protein
MKLIRFTEPIVPFLSGEDRAIDADFIHSLTRSSADGSQGRCDCKRSASAAGRRVGERHGAVVQDAVADESQVPADGAVAQVPFLGSREHTPTNNGCPISRIARDGTTAPNGTPRTRDVGDTHVRPTWDAHLYTGQHTVPSRKGAGKGLTFEGCGIHHVRRCSQTLPKAF